MEFRGFGIRGPGHPGKLAVEPEVILEGNRGERLVFILNRDLLLSLNRLVKTFRPTTARHCAPGKFINDNDLTLANDVINISLKEGMRLE